MLNLIHFSLGKTEKKLKISLVATWKNITYEYCQMNLMIIKKKRMWHLKVSITHVFQNNEKQCYLIGIINTFQKPQKTLEMKLGAKCVNTLSVVLSININNYMIKHIAKMQNIIMIKIYNVNYFIEKLV